MSEILGYARVSTQQQDLDSENARLTKVGAIRIFEDLVSGKILKKTGILGVLQYIVSLNM